LNSVSIAFAAIPAIAGSSVRCAVKSQVKMLP
jgi:hypothetical protein